MWNNVCELAEVKVITNENGFEEKSLIKNEVFCEERRRRGKGSFSSKAN